MKDFVQNVKDLRENNVPHHNCAQAITVTFAEEMGVTLEQARGMGAHFGAGMGCGSTCGVLTGALMTLGAMGYDKGESSLLLREFLQKHGSGDCRVLLAESAKRGESRACHCDGLIFEAVEFIARLEEEKQGKQEESTLSGCT